MYRALEPAELSQIQNTKNFQNIKGIENKYFSTTYQGAQYERTVLKIPENTPIVKTSFPKSSIDDWMELPHTDRGISGYVVPTEKLDLLSPPKIIK